MSSYGIITPPLQNLEKQGEIMSSYKDLPEGKEKRKCYLNSLEWAGLRFKVNERSGGMCERCHEQKAKKVHHLNQERLYNEDLADLIHLCYRCHGKATGVYVNKKKTCAAPKKEYAVTTALIQICETDTAMRSALVDVFHDRPLGEAHERLQKKLAGTPYEGRVTYWMTRYFRDGLVKHGYLDLTRLPIERRAGKIHMATASNPTPSVAQIALDEIKKRVEKMTFAEVKRLLG